MKTYVVGYDLQKPGKDYSKLIEAIKSYDYWAHALDSQWLIKSDNPLTAVRDHLSRFIDSNDKLLVASVSYLAWMGLEKEVANWINEN